MVLTHSSARRAKVGLATLALTFDYWKDASDTALGIMYPLGLVGTYYVQYDVVGQTNQVTISDLTAMKQLGWEIGAYTGDNMVTMWSNNRNTAFTKLKAIDDGMSALGFSVQTIAPNQRSWNSCLANLADGRYLGVRVADDTSGPEPLPIANPTYIRKGGAGSWSSSDTAASILARVDSLIASGGLGIEVIHKIGAVADDLTVNTQVFKDVMAGLSSRVAAGVLRVCPLAQAIKHPS